MDTEPMPIPDGPPPPLAHERLEVYSLARQLQREVREALKRVPAGQGHGRSKDDVRRASKSVTHNITEGGDEFSPKDKARFYRYARRSASEVAAGLDTLADWEGLRDADTWRPKWLVHRVNSMLTKMITAQESRARHS